jgi:hypothetical protein
MSVTTFLVMRQRLLISVIAAGALVLVPRAVAGGAFERVVGVGANGVWAEIKLSPSGPHSDSSFDGRAVAVPSDGYIRIYPLIGGLPGIPGRFYPAAHVLCLYWDEPVSNCSRLSAAGIALLGPFAGLPLLHATPTTLVAVRHRSRLLRYADGNIFAALELALERRPLIRSSLPPNAIGLTVAWRGPNAARRPSQLFLTPTGVYASKHLFPLQRGPWCYLAVNLPGASASLIEATTRVCK